MLHYHLTGSSSPFHPLAHSLLSPLCSDPSISNLHGKHLVSSSAHRQAQKHTYSCSYTHLNVVAPADADQHVMSAANWSNKVHIWWLTLRILLYSPLYFGSITKAAVTPGLNHVVHRLTLPQKWGSDVNYTCKPWSVIPSKQRPHPLTSTLTDKPVAA